MTPALAQASLFDSPAPADGSRSETATDRSVPKDDDVLRLRTVVSQLGRCSDPVDRIRSAVELKAAADTLIAEAVRDARSSGRSWRELGVDLGVPFQTLFRRYHDLAPSPSLGTAAEPIGVTRERESTGRT